MVSFDNTEVAFSGKSDGSLKRSYWLFKMLGSSSLVNMSSSMMNFAIKSRLPIKPIIKSTIFKQFCGGETIEECNNAINALGIYNIGTILDYSVEGKESEEDFNACTQEVLKTINRAKGDKKIPFCVFKVTGLAPFDLLEKASEGKPLDNKEKVEFQKVKERVMLICRTAADAKVPVFIDAEESWIQPAIDSLADDMMALYNTNQAIVYNTFQLYRKDRLDFLMRSYTTAYKGGYILGAKLVRGAYMEKERKRAAEMNYPSPIQDTKENTDHDFDAALKFALAHIDRIAICAGSHNEKSSKYLVEHMEEKKIAKNHPHVYFSQLYGMSDHISFNLANQGYNVAKYVPYGPVNEVLPYLIRRAQENTSVKGQTGRELGLIIKEKERRRKDN